MELETGMRFGSKSILHVFVNLFPKISPTQSLVYHPCFDDFKCARLEMPMDWRSSNEAETKSKGTVAVVRLPARVPVTDERRGGAVILIQVMHVPTFGEFSTH
jgi:hypothetical protein